MEKNLFNEVQQIIEAYDTPVTRSDGLTRHQKQVLKIVEYYSASKYLDGNEYELGTRPFYNITKFRVNVAIRATDMDTADIQAEAVDPDFSVQSMIFTTELDLWKKQTNYAKSLNKQIEILPKYGGLLVKKYETADQLYIEPVNWANVITDQHDIANGPIIEKHFMSVIDLSKKKEAWDGLAANWEDVKDLRNRHESINTEISKDKIVVYEIEAELPESCLREDGDEDVFVLQRHYIAGDEDGHQYCLHSEKLKESSYKYLSWHDSGFGLGVGVVEDAFEAQVAINNTVIKQQEINNHASKIIYQTDADTFENNIYTDLDNGAILKIDQGRSFSQVNTMPNSIPALNNYIDLWDQQVERVSSTFNAITGETMPSGTPFRQTAILNQEASSIFDWKREQMGIFQKEIFEKWVIPFLSKKITQEHILSGHYSNGQLKIIDEAFSRYSATKTSKEKALQGKVVTFEEYEASKNTFKSLLQESGDKRFVKVPKNYFKNIHKQINIVTTGEQKKKNVTLESLNNILVTVASNPQILQNDTLFKIFSRIVEIAGVGISPEELRAETITDSDTPETTVSPEVTPETNEPTAPVL